MCGYGKREREREKKQCVTDRQTEGKERANIGTGEKAENDGIRQ